MPTRKARLGALAAAVALLLTACGGGGSGDPADEIRGIEIDFVQALVDGKDAEACALTVNPEECAAVVALNRAFEPETGGPDLLPDDWRERIRSAEVTFSAEDRAQVAPIAGDDEPMQFVREDGEWRILVVIP